jgi:hypothetical protein
MLVYIYKLTYMSEYNHPVERLPHAAENPASVAYIDGLVDVAERLGGTLPEYKGMTLYGSTVRGETSQDSDVDISVFIELDETTPFQSVMDPAKPHLIEYVNAGPYTHSRRFVPLIESRYLAKLDEELSERGFPDSDRSILPISTAIVAENIQNVLDSAKAYRETQNLNDLHAPRNIRNLFQGTIDDTGLVNYRKQVLETLSQASEGQLAWKIIRFFAAKYEVGRNGDPNALSHRTLPEDLVEAVSHYEQSELIHSKNESTLAIQGVAKAVK